MSTDKVKQELERLAKRYSLNAAGMLNSGAPEHAQTIAIVELLSNFDDDEAESHWETIMAYSDFRTSDALFSVAETVSEQFAVDRQVEALRKQVISLKSLIVDIGADSAVLNLNDRLIERMDAALLVPHN
ncbi:hypothetical protein A3218_05835 [Pseudomonas chlororaphis]|uniref:hypothetical protein n=1 Tax=Pseudomonas chlororaphis TaxID=587753 RepID=UPI000789CDED|nr:hypothetical protein [Pseudomonas chlororaphis]AMS13834.1 hypothetical protein A3218_05835 [Pseudomonas chlororaphis]